LLGPEGVREYAVGGIRTTQRRLYAAGKFGLQCNAAGHFGVVR
jgi:hypothetical protein